MKFTHKCWLYGVNEDNTVTFYITDDTGKALYYRANARLKILTELDELDRDTELNLEFGVAYVRGKGLTLQIVKVL